MSQVRCLWSKVFIGGFDRPQTWHGWTSWLQALVLVYTLHPGKLTWNSQMEVDGRWFFHFNWVVFRFHVNFPGSIHPYFPFPCLCHKQKILKNHEWLKFFWKPAATKIRWTMPHAFIPTHQKWCTILQVQAANMPCQRSSSWYGLGHEDWTSLPWERTATRLLSFPATPISPQEKKTTITKIVWSNKFKYLRSHDIDIKIHICK